MDDFDRYDMKMQRKLEQCPICKNCHEHVQDDPRHYIPNFGYLCEKCWDECEEWSD